MLKFFNTIMFGLMMLFIVNDIMRGEFNLWFYLEIGLAVYHLIEIIKI